MKIAILTFHRAYNCGAMLQAWALRTVLERMGHTVEFPVLNHVGETKRWRIDFVDSNKRGFSLIRSFLGRSIVNIMSFPCEDISIYRFKHFRKHFLPERVCLVSDLDKYYDLVVVGSDQVWRESLSLSEFPVFLSESVPEGIRKIAYSASYGDKPLDDKSLKRVMRAIERFSQVSVRENLAKNQLSAVASKPIEVVADPTLLLNSTDYSALGEKVKVPKEPYLFMYTLTAQKFYVDIAKEMARRLGVKCIIAPCNQYSRYGAPNGLTYSISPDRLVALARGAKYVLAGSFHGTVMGVMFKKPFLSLREQVDEYESRPAALLNRIGCSNRLVNPTTSLDEMEALLRTEVDEEVYNKLAQFRTNSLSWLKEAVGSKMV